MKNKNAVSKTKPEPVTPVSPPGYPWFLIFVLVYVAGVLLIDTLAVHHVRLVIPWHILLRHSASGVDYFKFIAWFAIPFLFSLPRFDWGWLGIFRWKRIDLIILGALVVVCLGAVSIIPLFPSLRETYHSMAHIPAASKYSFVTHQVAWTFSWLIGWEFMHRCVLLRQVSARWPRWGWLIVPIFEGVYHLQKPPLEALGMVAFSAILTPWALRRQNVLLPFLAHLAIELELIAFLVLT